MERGGWEKISNSLLITVSLCCIVRMLFVSCVLKVWDIFNSTTKNNLELLSDTQPTATGNLETVMKRMYCTGSAAFADNKAFEY